MRKIHFHTLLILLNFSTVTAQNINYQTLYTGSTFDNRSVNQSLPVGSTQGVADVSSGAASYSVPIAVPPGTNGVAPSIAIVYQSMQGNGLLGRGWGISGLSAISRTSRNNYYDGETNAVVMNNSDRFVLDGTRLISKSGNYGDANSTYGTEAENFGTVTAKNTLGNGPEWFEVITKDGVKMEYGNSSDARQTGQYATVLVWGLSKVTYPDGNFMTFKYKSDAYFTLLIEEINYTGNSEASLSPYNQIRFDYKVRTVDGNTLYEDNTRIQNKHLLDKITVKAEDATV